MAFFSDFDSSGDRNRPPKLLNAADFTNWKYRIEQYLNLSDPTLWQSIVVGPHRPSTTGTDGITLVDKRREDYSEVDKRMVERDIKALAALSMSLPNELIHIYKHYTSAKSMWQALIDRFEGNIEVRETRQDRLRKQYEQFVVQKSESVEMMLNRYTHLISDVMGAAIDISIEQVNKKLLDALPNSWNMIIMMIKKTNNLKTMPLEDLIAMIRSYDNGLKRDVYADIDAPYTSVTNSALLGNISAHQVSAGPSSSSSSPSLLGNSKTVPFCNTPICNVPPINPSPVIIGQSSTSPVNQQQMVLPNLNQENFDVLCNVMMSYNAFVAGHLTNPQFSLEDIEQIHEDDMEEMDLQWQMAMLTMRTKKFFKRTGRRGFADPKKKMSFDKSKVECFNCHQQGHFARECTLPKAQVAPSSSSSSVSHSQVKLKEISKETALVSQQTSSGYDWSSQAEESLPVNTALMATINDQIPP